MKMSQTHTLISFIILNYNGKEITEKCIESLMRSVHACDYEIIIVDNGSNDGSVDFLKGKFPHVRIIEEKCNKFITAYNDGVSEAKGDWVFLLNNDMQFKDDFLLPLLPYLDKDDLFAIGSVMFSYDGIFQKGVNIPFFRFGYFWLKSVYHKSVSESIYIGTHGLFNKKHFLDLGGFDELYSPFYMEDVDLCYRAWKRGLKILVEPNSIIYHKHMGTISKFFSRRFILRIYARNHILFIWKNITSKRLILSHIFFYPFILLGAIIMGKFHYLIGSFDAFILLLKGKVRRDTNAIKKDEEILNKWEEKYGKYVLYREIFKGR